MAVATKLTTKRLTLEPLAPGDLEDIFQIARERESIEDFQYAADRLEDVKEWLEPSLENPLNLVWAIRKGGKTIGLFDLCFEAEYSDLRNQVCRVGYFVDHREQRRGFATEALAAVTAWVFDETDTVRVEAGVTLRNEASSRTLEKVGFVREKVIEANWTWRGAVYDSAYYYLSKDLFRP